MNVSVFRGSLLLVLNFYGLNALGATESLCNSGRDTIFTCRLGDGETGIVSLCKGRTPRTVDYLQITDKGVESTIVFDRDKPIFRWVDSATYTTYFGFKELDGSYVFGNPQETCGAKAFLEVSEDGGLSKTVRCRENSFGDKNFDSPAINEISDEVVRRSEFEFPP